MKILKFTLLIMMAYLYPNIIEGQKLNELPKISKTDKLTKANPKKTKTNKTAEKKAEKEEANEQAEEPKTKMSTDNFSKKNFAFIIGGGVSYLQSDRYLKPIVNQSNNNVIIEKASNLNPNFSLGIVYTPWIYNVEGQLPAMDEKGAYKLVDVINEVPKGPSMALFFNPLSIDVSEAALNKAVELGIGIGWRWGDFSLFLTYENLITRQPRDYFIEEYSSNDKNYTVDDEIQKSIDIDDDSIFTNKVLEAVGFKMVYSFGVIKSFSQSIKE